MTSERRRELISRAFLFAALAIIYLPLPFMIADRTLRYPATLCTLTSNACCVASVWTATNGRLRGIRVWLLYASAALLGFAALMLTIAVMALIDWIGAARATRRKPA